MTAKWKQLADQLADEIPGKRPPGSQLPPIRELARELGYSSATVQQAYHELTRRGLTVPTRGHGTQVRPDLTAARVPLYRPAGTSRGTPDEWETAVAEAGLVGRVQRQKPETLTAPPPVAEALGIPAGAPVLRQCTRVLLGKDVVQHDEAWYPEQLADAAGLDDPDLLDVDPLDLLAQAGILPAHAHEDVTADIHVITEAEQPPVKVRGALLRLTRTTRGRDGHAVEHVRTIAAADRLRLAYSLPLTGSSSGT